MWGNSISASKRSCLIRSVPCSSTAIPPEVSGYTRNVSPPCSAGPVPSRFSLHKTACCQAGFSRMAAFQGKKDIVTWRWLRRPFSLCLVPWKESAFCGRLLNKAEPGDDSCPAPPPPFSGRREEIPRREEGLSVGRPRLFPSAAMAARRGSLPLSGVRGFPFSLCGLRAVAFVPLRSCLVVFWAARRLRGGMRRGHRRLAFSLRRGCRARRPRKRRSSFLTPSRLSRSI